MAVAMDLSNFTHKSLITTPHRLTYSYYLSPFFQQQTTENPSNPAILLLHGFPDQAAMWSGVVPSLLQLGYASYRYNYRDQAASLAQILEHENVASDGRIIPCGHDWGSATAQRFYLYHRHLCRGLILLSLAYQIPSPKPFNLEEQNAATSKRFGYPQWAYWEFFTAPDAPETMRHNLERFWDVNNGFQPGKAEGGNGVEGEDGRDVWMREMFCESGSMRAYIEGTGKYKDWTVQPKKYPNWQQEKERFVQRFSRDGFEGPVCYYLSLKGNTMLEDEKWLCEREGQEDRRRIDVPLLFVGQTGDWVCRTDLMKDAKDQGLVNDVTEKVLDAGHWWAYEKPQDMGGIIADWLKERFPIK
ncbi:Bifunctional epoxide hydrolase 2 [Cyphellophora attinorum]|uniref:Bifunctional epoxide hydrolase 2 n=1 Tax=Cyphellophora attinorum TaxID=1664694 RepID=A0A0N1HSV6_9EURO|nr:Bifunctional epoxide hydrolase 2 [Phialophora attinorum]KPI39416.1 Bifunctional epoxide hydrolase 2 [Phialophora attinorum]